MSNDEGTVYFIHPQKGFKDMLTGRDLVYDITYLTNRDSATYNFTFYHKIASPVDSVSFTSNNGLMILPAGMLFIEPYKKDLWKHRVTVKIPNQYIEGLYENTEPYNIRLYSGNNKYEFVMKQKQWKEQSLIVNKIFQLILINKR